MNRKQRIIVSVTGIILVFLILVGLTYAYFLTKINGNPNDKSISVTTANLELTYEDGNGFIKADLIEPGEVISSKTFTVKNEGNSTVNNYAVYLEELVNTLTRTKDMVYSLSCESDKDKKECNGVKETIFPIQNGIVITNDIDVGETQRYELKVTYKEMGEDQSIDMNKEISAKIQIYNLADIVDITGNITNVVDGDYVEMNSNPKISQIRDSKYLIPAVEPGTHTLYVKDKNGVVKGSKQITINKGKTANINGDVIIVTNDSQTVNLNITNVSSTLTINIESIKEFNPFEEGTLANAIYDNAKIKANGTEFLEAPRTKPGETIAYFMKNVKMKISDIIDIKDINTDTLYMYDTEEDAWSEDGGMYSSDHSKGIQKKYNSCQESDVGKFLYDINETLSFKAIKIEGCLDGEFVFIRDKVVYESSLTLTKDDYGTSYYFRGNVQNNYVNFAGMCWRIVRISGDGSIKLILEDQNNLCEVSVGNWNVGNGNPGYTEYEPESLSASDGTKNDMRINKADYLNGKTNYQNSMATAFKNFQTGPLARYLSYLKAGDWCLNDKAYASSKDNLIPLTSQEILDMQIKYEQIYYDSYVRLNKETKVITLLCNGANMNKFGDGVNMYVGALTVDELLYAGISSKINNNINYNNYLLNTYQKNNSLNFITFSYFRYFGGDDTIYTQTYDDLIGDSPVAASYNFRPAINLKSGILITGGDGTKNNAYTIAS